MTKPIALVLPVVLGLVAPGLAGERPPVVLRGTAGLDPVPFRALNRSATGIECQASIAHWYSAEIGRAEPGRAVVARLWSNPADGAVYLLNTKSERMPVQALFCGIEGRAASTRADVLLSRRAGGGEPAIDLECDSLAPGGALACRPKGTR